MNEGKTVVFVEGTSDKRFLSQYLDHINIDHINVKSLDGDFCSMRHFVINLVNIELARENRVAFVLDADHNFSQRRIKIESIALKLNLSINDFFLLPNNKSTGNLESLLEQIVPVDHRKIIECFELYQNCIKQHSSQYNLPNGKAKIYAYSKTIGLNPKADKINYLNLNYWDLNSEKLNPLNIFLNQLQ